MNHIERTVRQFSSLLTLSSTCLIGLALTACGGGGGSSSNISSGSETGGVGSGGPGTLTEVAYAASIYDPHIDLWQICESPRIGLNPQTNAPYSDIQGTAADENNWLRSYTNDTYLWYDELPDLDPNTYDDPHAYFELMRTMATTASGTLKDQFSGYIETESYLQLAFSGESIGYGIETDYYVSGASLIVEIRYVEAGSPAALAGLKRGDLITHLNGNLLTFAITEEQFYGIYPREAGVTHTFTIERHGETNFDVTITSDTLQDAPLHIAKTLDIGDDKIGYMMLNTFGSTSAERPIIEAITDFETAAIDDLVLDLRYNGGGFLALSSMLAYMVAGGTATQEKTFERTQFNDKHSLIDPVTGETLEPIEFLSTSYFDGQSTPLPELNLSRLFVLTDEGTCSASEALMNGLRGIDIEIIQIGDTTCGKPYGFYLVDNCGTSYAPVQFRSVNAKGFSEYADGFTPSEIASPTDAAITGCFAEDDLLSTLGATDEPKLAAALAYRASGECPVELAGKLFTVKPEVSQADRDAARALFTTYDNRLVGRDFIGTNRILNQLAP